MKCPNCGVETNGFESPKKPAHCICEPLEWLTDEIPPVCSKYQSQVNLVEEYCKDCDHELGCHRLDERMLNTDNIVKTTDERMMIEIPCKVVSMYQIPEPKRRIMGVDRSLLWIISAIMVVSCIVMFIWLMKEDV